MNLDNHIEESKNELKRVQEAPHEYESGAAAKLQNKITIEENLKKALVSLDLIVWYTEDSFEYDAILPKKEAARTSREIKKSIGEIKL